MNAIFIFGAQYLFLFIPVFAFIYLLKQKPGKRKQVLLLALIALPLVYLMGKIAGYFYYDPRPFITNRFIPIIPSATDNGFPSDHTLFSAAIAAIVFCHDRRWGAFLWIITFFVAAFRVYVGVHSVQDVLGSMVIAAFFTWLTFKFIKRYFFIKTS